MCVPVARAQTALVNGTNAPGTLLASTTNSYTLTANTGDNIVLRLGTDRVLRQPESVWAERHVSENSRIWHGCRLDYTATNSGSFKVEVSSFAPGGSGTYVLHLAQFPEAFIVPAGDEGGPMTNGGNYAGTITLGDLDLWSFTATAGDNIVLRLGTTSFDGDLSLYGPNGALLTTAVSGTDAELDFTATNSGTFTALVRSFSSGGTGTYVLHLAPVSRGVHCARGG